MRDKLPASNTRAECGEVVGESQNVSLNYLTFGINDVVVRAFDVNGVSLGGILFDDPGDAAVGGGTAEDRFFGVIFAGGVSPLTTASLNGATDWALDH